MSYLFVSYSSVDGANVATRLADALASGEPPFPVWFDKEKLQPGFDWDEQIDEALQKCRAVLLVMTLDSVMPNSVCKIEWTRALSYNKPVIPLRFDTAELPFRLASRHYLDFTTDFDIALTGLRQHLQWLDSPQGTLAELRIRLRDAERQLRRVAADRRGGVEAEITTLEQQIVAQERAVAEETPPPETNAPIEIVPAFRPAEAPPSLPMIDRTAELGELRGALDGVVSGRSAAAVLVVGACGVGKSRLVDEVVVNAAKSAVPVLRGQCVGPGAEPLLPVREALSSFLGNTPGHITQVIESVAPQLRDLAPFLQKFLIPVAEPAATGPQLGGSGVQGVYAGLEQVIRELAEQSGLCLLIEDVHDADQDTLYFLTYLAQKATGTRTLAVLTIDEDQFADTGLQGTVDGWLVHGWSRLDLPAWPREQISEYISAVSGRPPTDDVVDLLEQLTAGNTLLLKELLPLVESGRASTLEFDITTMTLPRRVRAVLDRQLLHLDKEPRRFVDAMAVCVEGTAGFAVVPGVLNLDDDAALELLEECSRRGLVVESTSGQVRFIHEAMRLAVYASVPDLNRRRLHEKAAEWFENQGDPGSAAHHFGRAGRTADMARNALKAAQLAEHVGMYRSAVMLYEQARPHCDMATVGPPLARALIMLGRWDEAEEILRGLPDDGTVRLLWSDLHFVRGHFRAAAATIEEILPGEVDRRLDCLVRLADIHLYLGDFAIANRHARDALDAAEQRVSVTDRARCLGIVGATLLFAGDLDEARRRFGEAFQLLDDIPEHERDRTPYTVILDNLGQVAEIDRDWPTAERYHVQALDLRREVFDARGLLHSLHALARVRIGSGETDRAADLLDEAERLATSLGETLEHAKITLTRAKLAARDGERDRALALVEDALLVFTECGTSFDVAHARLARTEMLPGGDARRSTWEGAGARAMVARRDFGLLRRNFPAVLFPYDAGIIAGLVAYACGDAFGLPWEGSPPSEVDIRRAALLPARPGWSRGATSDDTALTLLVAQVLTSGEPHPADGFLRLLSDQAATIPGLGPSTTAAIRAVRRHRPPAGHGRADERRGDARSPRRMDRAVGPAGATARADDLAVSGDSSVSGGTVCRVRTVGMRVVGTRTTRPSIAPRRRPGRSRGRGPTVPCRPSHRAGARCHQAGRVVASSTGCNARPVRHRRRGAVVCFPGRIAARRHRGGRHPRRRHRHGRGSRRWTDRLPARRGRGPRDASVGKRRRATRRSARLGPGSVAGVGTRTSR